MAAPVRGDGETAGCGTRRAKQQAERDKLVRRLHETLPPRMRSKQALRQMVALLSLFRRERK